MAEHEHDVVFSAEGLKKTYPPATHALRGANVQFRAGEIHGIAGVKGAGKSTLIKILAGVESPTAGTISLHGVGKLSLERASDAQAVGIGVVHQELPLLPNLTAAENVNLTIASAGQEREEVAAAE